MALSSPEAARHAAQSILAEDRFHGSGVPSPLHGVLVRIGRLVSDPLAALDHLVSRIGDWFPGGVAGVWAAGAAVLLAGVAVLATRRARTRLGLEPRLIAADRRPISPAELERAAAAAELAGHWDEAVRFRFRAGVLRLGERLELPSASADTVPNQAIASMVRSSRFDALADRFDEVAYGGSAASAADAEHQRHDWPELLAEAARR